MDCGDVAVRPAMGMICVYIAYDGAGVPPMEGCVVVRCCGKDELQPCGLRLAAWMLFGGGGFRSDPLSISDPSLCLPPFLLAEF
jgi:hypothetical protein